MKTPQQIKNEVEKEIVFKVGDKVRDKQGYEGVVESIPYKYKDCIYIRFRNGALFLELKGNCIKINEFGLPGSRK
jgi:hypothetical protein